MGMKRPLPRNVKHSFSLGLDLGGGGDYTALCITETITEPREDWSSIRKDVEMITRHEVRHIERFPLGLTFPEQCDRVIEILNRSPLSVFPTRLIVDKSGIGRPVTDMLRERKVRLTGVSITGGDGDRRVGSDWNVSKSQLVSRLQAMLHSGELKIMQGTAEAELLRRELQDFRIRYSAAGNQQFEARQGKHDDLVLSLCLSCYFLSRKAGKVSVTYF